MTPKALRRIAEQIDAHLKRFETDPVINALQLRGGMNVRPFFHAQATATRQYLTVKYVDYQGTTKLTPEDAERYLARLDAGFVGTHFDAFR